MTFEYRDPDGDAFTVRPTIGTPEPAILLHISPSNCAHVPLGRVEEVVAGIRDAARTASGQQAAAATCAHCKGTGADPEDEGDYDPNVHMYNPTTIGPCPECHGTGKDAPAVGQPAEAQATDRAAVLAEAIAAAEGELLQDDTGSSDDEAYNRGVHDVIVALRRMAEEARS